MLLLQFLKGQALWLIPITPAIGDMEIRRIFCPGKKLAQAWWHTFVIPAIPEAVDRIISI
jgi:hypothetical protein